jgi:hypothetical protein
MTGRIARVKLTMNQLARLQAGGRVSVRLPKDVALLRLTLKEPGYDAAFAELSDLFDQFWKDWGRIWKKLPFGK